MSLFNMVQNNFLHCLLLLKLVGTILIYFQKFIQIFTFIKYIPFQSILWISLLFTCFFLLFQILFSLFYLLLENGLGILKAKIAFKKLIFLWIHLFVKVNLVYDCNYDQSNSKYFYKREPNIKQDDKRFSDVLIFWKLEDKI